MEFTTFNSLGQWSLHKSSKLDFNDFRGPKTGDLPKDSDTKGMLHGAGNNKRPKPQMSDHKMEGQVPTPKVSSYASRNPSLEDDSPSPKIDNL
jgi:hypothetical protein